MNFNESLSFSVFILLIIPVQFNNLFLLISFLNFFASFGRKHLVDCVKYVCSIFTGLYILEPGAIGQAYNISKIGNKKTSLKYFIL